MLLYQIRHNIVNSNRRTHNDNEDADIVLSKRVACVLAMEFVIIYLIEPKNCPFDDFIMAMRRPAEPLYRTLKMAITNYHNTNTSQ